MFKLILYWALSILISLFSLLFIFGLMDNLLSFGRTGPQDVEEKIHAGSAFSLQTMNHFLQAALSGIMPGGEKTSLPLFQPEGMKLLVGPYKDWAPEPFSKMPGPSGPFGAQTPISPPPMIRMIHILSGLGSIFEDAFSQQLPENLERSFILMKHKIWFGMAPITEARWKSKDLDKQANIEEAIAIIEQVVAVWKYLCSPKVQGDIRHAHNKLWTEIDVFQDALAAHASSSGETLGYNFTALWHEFIKCHFEHMQVQSRSWLYTHLKTLQNIWKDRFVAVMGSGRVVSETHQTIRIDHYAMMILNKIQDIYLDADIYVRQRTEGFITADRRIDPRLSQIEAPKAQLNAAYAGIFAEMEASMRGVLQRTLAARIAQRHQVMPVPAFLEAPSLVVDREVSHKSLSFEIDAPIERQVEGWVRERMEDKFEEFGFVVYRLCYEGSTEEWNETAKKIEEGINSGWEGIKDADKINRKAKFHWIDGRDEKISEGDLDGARKDFQIITSLEAFPKDLAKTVCLAITPTSLSSFKPSQSLPPLPALFDDSPNSTDEKEPLSSAGDFRPFLHTIDATFNLPSDLPSTSSSTSNPPRPPPPIHKEYTGTFPILDQLVWPDLLGLFIAGARISLEDMWALSLQHPWGVYVGPTTGVRRREFREMRQGMGILLDKGKKEGVTS